MLSGSSLVQNAARRGPPFWPGVALSLAMLGANMLGDALRDLPDPRFRGNA
jgi:ABC-type dipeptide/oligopeptide/nickel transport system permease subunit